LGNINLTIQDTDSEQSDIVMSQQPIAFSQSSLTEDQLATIDVTKLIAQLKNHHQLMSAQVSSKNARDIQQISFLLDMASVYGQLPEPQRLSVKKQLVLFLYMCEEGWDTALRMCRHILPPAGRSGILPPVPVAALPQTVVNNYYNNYKPYGQRNARPQQASSQNNSNQKPISTKPKPAYRKKP